jgi:hypothetical protein
MSPVWVFTSHRIDVKGIGYYRAKISHRMQQACHEYARPANIYRIKYRRFFQRPNNPQVRDNTKFKAVVELVLQPFEQLRFIGHIAIDINCGLKNKGFILLSIISDRAGC